MFKIYNLQNFRVKCDTDHADIVILVTVKSHVPKFFTLHNCSGNVNGICNCKPQTDGQDQQKEQATHMWKKQQNINRKTKKGTNKLKTKKNPSNKRWTDILVSSTFYKAGWSRQYFWMQSW